MSEEQYRTVEIYREGSWEKDEFLNLKDGTIFRMFDPDGTPVRDEEGYINFKVVGNVYSHPEWSVPTVNTESIEEIA